MVCLDTSVILALIRKEEKALQRLRTEAERGGTVSTAIISLCELYAGAYASREPVKELEKVQGLISQFQLLELTVDASRKYGELANHLAIKGQPIGDFDLIIASIAMSHGEVLATHNLKHFRRVPGLVAEPW